MIRRMKKGDMVQPSNLEKDNYGIEEDGYFVVKWDNEISRFCFDGDGITVDFGRYYSHEIEVIGNTYDNPELLN